MRPFSYYRTRINLFLLAVFLWLFVVTGREYEIYLDIPLVVENLRPGKILSKGIPETVRVNFRGLGRSLILLQLFHDSYLGLDISSIREYYDYPVIPEYVKTTSSLKVQAVSIVYPDTVLIRLEERVEKSATVAPKTELKAMPGYIQVGDIDCNPAEVLISGPISIVKNVNMLITETIDLQEISGNISVTAKLVNPYPQITLSSEEVIIDAAFERLTEVYFRNIPIDVINYPQNYTVNVEPGFITVALRGAVSVIKNTSEKDILAIIVFSGVWDGESNAYVPDVTVPEDVELIQFLPDTVYITLMEGR